MRGIISGDKPFQVFSINVKTLVIGMMIINYGLFGYGLNLNKQNLGSISVGTRTVFYNLLLIVSTYLLIKKTHNAAIKIKIDLRIIIFAVSATLIAVLSNFQIYQTYLNGDELAYVSNSWFHSAKVIADFSKTESGILLDSQMLDLLKIPIVLMLAVLTIFIILTKKTSNRVQASLTVISVVILQQLNNHYFNFNFQYLSGYTFAPLITSTLFPNDFAMRVGNTAFFYLLISMGLFRRKSRKQDLAWMISILVMLSIPAFSNFIPVVDTVSYFVSFGFIILFRTLNAGNYDIRVTLWIACISIFFRPANIVWLILVLLCIHFKEKKYLKDIDSYVPILLVVPFIADIAMQKLTLLYYGIASGNSQSGGSLDLDSYKNYFISIYKAYDQVTFTLLLISLILFLCFKVTRYILFVYVALLLFTYVPLIPNGISGHYKYAFETTLPLIVTSLSILIKSILKHWFRIQSYFGIAILICVISFGWIQQNRQIFADETISSKGQLQNFYGYPLENRLNLRDLSRFVTSRECRNTGSIYGDSYFYLRGEKISETLARKEKSSGYEFSEDNLNPTRDDNCLIVDSMINKSEYTSRLSETGWLRVYLITGEKFGSTSEIWINQNQ
jgi:hypothetical protein